MTTNTTTFWQFLNELRAKSYDRLDIYTTLRQAREQGIPITLDDVRRLATLQRHEGIFLSEAYIPEFMTAYLRHLQVHSILDPFAGVGGIIGPVTQALAPERAIGLDVSPRMAEIARIIHEGASVEWRVGNPDGLLPQMTEPFDVIVGCPPLGMPKVTRALDVQGHIINLHDESGRIIAAEALRLLGAHGVALFLTTTSFLFSADARSVSAQLEQFGVYLDAALLVRQGAFEPAAHLPGLLVILKRVQPDRVFVGELDAETARNGALLNNLLQRKESQHPQLGALVKRANLTSVEAVFANQRIQYQARKMGVPAVPLADVALEINLVRSPQSFESRPNCIYLPLIGQSKAVASLDDLKIKPHNYAQIVLDPEKANAHYVADFLNTPLGLLIRESLLSGAWIPHITKTTLGHAQLYLPGLETQARALSVQARLTDVETEVDQLRRKLAEFPNSVSRVEKAVEKWEQNTERNSTAWYETLPFPLASILWAYHADDNVEHRVDYLLHFFEALSEYRATVLLSAFASDSHIYAQYSKAWITDDPKHRDAYKQSSFGFWNILGSHLAKQVRELLDNEQEKQRCLDLFHQDDQAFVEMMAERKLASVLDEARNLRNPWTGHDGLPKTKHYQRRLSELEQVLARIRSLISDYHATTWLIQPGSCELTAGICHYQAKLLMGTHSAFQTVRVDTLSHMDTQDLYLLREGASHPLRLLPLLRMIAAPETEITACYFYSKLQNNGVRFVSYQLEGEPDLVRPDAQVIRALELLSPDWVKEEQYA